MESHAAVSMRPPVVTGAGCQYCTLIHEGALNTTSRASTGLAFGHCNLLGLILGSTIHGPANHITYTRGECSPVFNSLPAGIAHAMGRQVNAVVSGRPRLLGIGRARHPKDQEPYTNQAHEYPHVLILRVRFHLGRSDSNQTTTINDYFVSPPSRHRAFLVQHQFCLKPGIRLVLFWPRLPFKNVMARGGASAGIRNEQANTTLLDGD